MIWRAVIFLVLLPTLCLAQDFAGHQASTLDAVFETWDGITKAYKPGISILQPQKIRFVATLQVAPESCSNAPLEAVLRMLGAADLLRQVSVTHCVVLSSARRRTVAAFVQDLLVPGLNSDAKPGHRVEIYADFLAYVVDADRSRNAPILLVSRFEPL
jgi:hypothetical protein